MKDCCAAADLVVVILKLEESVETGVHAHTDVRHSADERSRPIDLSRGARERAVPRQKTSGPDGPPHAAVGLAISRLRNKSCVSAKAFGDVSVFRADVEMRRVARPF